MLRLQAMLVLWVVFQRYAVPQAVPINISDYFVIYAISAVANYKDNDV